MGKGFVGTCVEGAGVEGLGDGGAIVLGDGAVGEVVV